MRSISFIFLVIFFLPQLCISQLTGLGNYQIAVTPSDFPNKIDFTEGEQTYVKGTLALECPHIRTFKSAHTIVDGIAVSNLVLCFYDDKLFMISCDYTDALQKAFQKQHGRGINKEPENILLCAKRGSEPMNLRGEFWRNADILAFAIHIKGVTMECSFKKTHSLIITSQTLLALSSECNFQEIFPFADEFLKTIK